MLYPFWPQDKFIDCVCIKEPEGYMENYKREPILVGNTYKYEITGVAYRIYCKESGDSLFIRDEVWFHKYFRTKESLRDELIDQILGID
jgi:hypothetical protein